MDKHISSRLIFFLSLVSLSLFPSFSCSFTFFIVPHRKYHSVFFATKYTSLHKHTGKVAWCVPLFPSPPLLVSLLLALAHVCMAAHDCWDSNASVQMKFTCQCIFNAHFSLAFFCGSVGTHWVHFIACVFISNGRV